MGCDGGTIPRRDELVRVKKKPEQKDRSAEMVAKWKHCALSQEPLRNPIVSCELGRLYNKEAIIEFLLSKDSSNEIAEHIRTLKDIKQLNLTENSGFQSKGADKGDQYVDLHDSRYICPVVGLEMNGKYRFCFLWKCGCVISERAIKEVKSEVCHKCGKPFDGEDVVIINGMTDDMDVLTENMERRRYNAKLEKKRKKSKTSVEEVEDKKIKTENGTAAVHKNTVVTESKTEKNVMSSGRQDASAGTSNVSTAAKLILPEKAQKKYSIAKDPNASAAFKSLFTSHDNAKLQAKAHWITHNPLYF